ncbi:MAG: hypothetical protein ACI4QM_03820 [Alphaproteobacteria bacterium]
MARRADRGPNVGSLDSIWIACSISDEAIFLPFYRTGIPDKSDMTPKQPV